MNTLPSELLHGIFIHLPVIQQLQCMLVSRRWATIIHGRSLYHSVYAKSEEMFQCFLEIIKQKPELATNVEHLLIWRVGPLNVSEREILELFPNLKTLAYSKFDSPQGTANISNGITRPLSRKLTSIRDVSDGVLTRLGLAEGLFTHLISLYLNFSTEHMGKRNPMVPLLKDMPALKYLELDNIMITIDDFETLHSNIPSLQSLKVLDMQMWPSDFPTGIKPARAFTSLEFYGEFEVPQSKYDLFKYIIEKYPHLTHLVYSVRDWIPDDFDKSSLILRADFPDVVHKLGSQLQTLSYYGDMDIFSKEIQVNKSKWNLKKVIYRQCINQSKLAALTQLHQFRFVENLDLCISRLPFSLSRLTDMKHLRFLRLHFFQWDDTLLDSESGLEHNKSITLNLDELFQHLHSSVESVHVYCRYAGFDDDLDIQYTNIKTLILEVSTPQKKFDSFITKRLPNLHSLTLSDSYKLGETLNFPNHQFSFLKIYSYTRSIVNVSIITDDFYTEHFYTTNPNYFHQYADFNDFILIASSEGVDDGQVLFLVCKSVRRLVLGSSNNRNLDALLIPC
jgi:hypothetical protein